MSFELGEFCFTLRSSPGHSPDSIVCLVHGEDILFAADTVMPVPYFVDGSFTDLERSLRLLLDEEYENIVQGHGEIILRGEAPEKIASDLEYLHRLVRGSGARHGSGSREYRRIHILGRVRQESGSLEWRRAAVASAQYPRLGDWRRVWYKRARPTKTHYMIMKETRNGNRRHLSNQRRRRRAAP